MICHLLENGYSGFYPDSYVRIREGLEQYELYDDTESNNQTARQFKHYAADNPGLKLLNECPIQYLIVKHSFGTPEDLFDHPATSSIWSLVLQDETAGIDIYERDPKNRSSIESSN